MFTKAARRKAEVFLSAYEALGGTGYGGSLYAGEDEDGDVAFVDFLSSWVGFLEAVVVEVPRPHEGSCT